MIEPILRIGVLIDKELRQLLRDKRAVGLILAMSVLVPTVLGWAYSGEIGHMPIAICNLDDSQISWKIVDAFESSRDFDVLYYVDSVSSARRLVEDKEVFGAIIIPHGFGEELARSGKTYIIVVSDRSNTYLASALESAAQVLVSEINKEMLGEKGVEMIIETVYGPKYSSVDLILPPILGMVIMLVGSGLMSVSVARERERGTIEQLVMTPLTVWEMVVGKFAAYTLVMWFDVSLTILIVTHMFGAVVKGGIENLMMLSFIFTIGSIALGLFLSTLSANQLQAQQAVLLVYIPSMLFSGIFMPVEISGPIVRIASYYNPMFRFIRGAKLIVLNGYSILEVGGHLHFLLAFAFIMLILSIVSLKVKLL